MSLKRRHKAAPNLDCLESRALLTAGAGSTFAIMQATIQTTGGTVDVPITIDTAHFTAPKSGKLLLGLDVAATNSSTAKPVIVQVLDGNGKPIRGVSRKVYDPRVKTSVGSVAATAITVPLNLGPLTHATKGGSSSFSTKHFTVRVATTSTTSGNILLGSYLPGDANGDGQVTSADITLIKKSVGTLATSTTYNFDQDSNRDGRIGMEDLKIAQRNLGAKTMVVPSISANLDPTSDTGAQDRITSLTTVHFTGTTTPGATVNYTEVNNKVGAVETKADPSGNYNLNPGLANGSNTFRVTTLDSYGQSVSGTIQAVIRNNNPPPQLSSVVNTAKNVTTTSGNTTTPKTT